MTDDCRPTVWPGQLTSGDRFGASNCAAYSLAKGLEFDSCGAIKVTGAKVRSLTSEPIPDPDSPGLHHGQLRDVAAKFGVRLELIAGGPWAEVTDALRLGHGVLLAVSYRLIRLTKYSGQRSFYGGHELFVMPGRYTYDPLCDGRLSGGQRVFRGPATYPESLLMNAAGGFAGIGVGRVVAAVLPHRHPLTADLPDTSTTKYSVSFLNGEFYLYTLSDGVITGRTGKAFSGPTSAACGSPRVYPWPGHESRKLVQMTAGVLKGKYVSVPQGSARLVEK